MIFNIRYVFILLSINVILNGCIKHDIRLGKIIFSDGEKILEIDPDGKNMKVITSSIGAGTLSPNGEKIIFGISEREEKDYIKPKPKESKLFLMNIRDNTPIKLTEEYIDVGASFSPDSKKIVFSSNRDGEDYEIYVMNIDEPNNIIRLTDNTLEDENAEWSPDGGKIVFQSSIYIDIPYIYFSSEEETPLDKQSKSTEIYIMNVEGKNVTRLTNNSVFDGQPTWSPDSKKIAFVSDNDLCIMDVDGKNLINLTKNNPRIVKAAGGKNYYQRYHGLRNYSIVCPVWSPCGKYISFILIGGREKTKTNIYVINIDGKNIRQVTSLDFVVNIAWLSTSPLDK